jgi:hypothetical protein
VKIVSGGVIGFLPRVVFAAVDYGSIVQGDEPELYVDKCGRGDTSIVSNSYLFVDFKYVSAPYSIQRSGQAVVVNGVVANCLYKGNILTNQPSLQVGPDGKAYWQTRKKDMSKVLPDL